MTDEDLRFELAERTNGFVNGELAKDSALYPLLEALGEINRGIRALETQGGDLASIGTSLRSGLLLLSRSLPRAARDPELERVVAAARRLQGMAEALVRDVPALSGP